MSQYEEWDESCPHVSEAFEAADRMGREINIPGLYTGIDEPLVPAFQPLDAFKGAIETVKRILTP